MTVIDNAEPVIDNVSRQRLRGLLAALTVLNERQLRKLRQGGYPQGETRGDRDDAPSAFRLTRWRPSFGSDV